MYSDPFDRRRFLSRAAIFAAGLPLVGLSRRISFAAAAAELPARRMFFDNPDYLNLQISPDGEHLAYLAPIGGVRNLWLAPVAKPDSGVPVTHAVDRNIADYFVWAHTNRHLVFFQERDGDENWRASSVDIVTGTIVPLTPEQGVRSSHQESDYRFPDEMLFRHNQRDKRFFDLYRINLVTGRSEILYENHDYVGLITDSTFRLRLGQRFAADGSAEYFERQADGRWAPFTTVPISDIDATRMIDFSDDGKTLYMLDSRGRDKAALVAVDMATRQSEVLAADDEADIVTVHFESKTRRPLAALAIKDRARWHALDPSIDEDLARLSAYGRGDVAFHSRSADNRKVTVFLERDTASGEPASRSTGLPLVLVIHGGPYFRDQWGFNATHQWLASRGYAVLSVNYRGSTGFGKAFVTAADHEWGGRMHDDLIDAVEWAIGRGFVDRKRIGFYGGSYGGYSALMAATKTPEIFACIIDLFGISNLITFMATIPPYWGPWWSIWKNRLADPETEVGREFLRERSPINHIERATRPILIAQGMNDVRVVAAESEQMVAALERRGVPVTYVTFADEGHGFVRPENRLAFFAVAEAFLAKHLGGRSQPIGDDFAGSTLKIETGGELVPGLLR